MCIRDSNMLVMEVLRKTANKHDMVCLLHEKPFSGMNGSGTVSYTHLDVYKRQPQG